MIVNYGGGLTGSSAASQQGAIQLLAFWGDVVSTIIMYSQCFLY